MAGQRFVAPQLATLVAEVPTADGWTFEIKYDGYRLQALLHDGAVRLLTRRGNDWTARFPHVAERLARIPVDSATLDGELVALDESGKSVFNLLQQSLDGHDDRHLVFFAFDILYLDGADLREEPARERRATLARVLRRARVTERGAVRIGQEMPGTAKTLMRAACRLGLEGVIGKRLDASYASGRNGNWIKVKCGKRQEFVVVGFTPPQRSRVGIGSLLLGVYERGKLRYAGRVGSGFADSLLRKLLTTLGKLERDTMPLPIRPRGIPAGARWVDPVMVVEVAFTEWTPDGLLRHPVFQGIREDKAARDVHREREK